MTNKTIGNRTRCLQAAVGHKDHAALVKALEENDGDLNTALYKVGKELPAEATSA